ncbi:MAG: hypothetical protein JXM71_11555, partial [Spirochaetales bacterium]|nr:hypothetical protein [Spirochaetales bacterium]
IMPLAVLSETLDLLAGAARSGGADPIECTVEANPEDITGALLDLLAATCCNRLSVGVQSLEDEARLIAGRRGSAADTMSRLEFMANTWDGRWSADLMYGLPGQTVAGLERDMSTIISLGAGHISLYELTLEPETPLGRDVSAGRLLLPDEDLRWDQYLAATDALGRAGYTRYEVSNWCLPGHECAHNGVYWRMGNWLAVGPAGTGNVTLPDGSYLRMDNSSDDDSYFANPAGTVVETRISGVDAVFEYLMTTMRRRQGMALVDFKARFGLEAIDVFGPLHERFENRVELVSGSWRASDHGLDTLNTILVEALTRAQVYFADAAP